MERSLEQFIVRTLRVLQAYGVPRAGLYGSWVRGEQSDSSDIDIVVERPGSFSLYDLIRLQQALSDALGIEAHVTTYGSLHPKLKAKILSEELRILG